ncbi:MAG: LptE family protein [Candidatus Omnitrophica bacterium]|nr:LptE family protein [Candidatus Omnitrophota bacterium]
MKKIFLLLMAGLLAGCGYSTQSLLPENYKVIHVEPFENKIDFVSQDQRKLYLPGLENRVREAVVDRYLLDGNLHITDKDTADLILKGQLLSFDREELRVNTNDTVKEYRIRITAALKLIDPAEDKPVWEEPSFAGEATYYTTGPLAKSESQAIQEALTDFAQRTVARTIENW